MPILQFFPTAEGFFDYENNEYIYQYKDHLGNVRISYRNNNGIAEITDQNDYYPFGMNIPREEESIVGVASLYNYKYSNKEIQETGFLDFGWRQYASDLGRWFGVDQLAEMYDSTSPYAFVDNNPLRFIDPDGRCKSDINGNFPTADCTTPIEEVVIQGTPKPKPQPKSLVAAPTFFSFSSFGSYSAGSGGGGVGGGGGGGIGGGFQIPRGSGEVLDSNIERLKKMLLNRTS